MKYFETVAYNLVIPEGSKPWEGYIEEIRIRWKVVGRAGEQVIGWNGKEYKIFKKDEVREL